METKRLYKIEQGRMVCGVCGGFAEYLNLDPSLVRILWVLLTFAGGSGIVAYIIAAVILPDKSKVV